MANAMNLIVCRNVLMYFSPEQARQVVANLHHSLVEGGLLMMSPTEASQESFRACVGIVVLGTAERRIDFAVDTVMSEQEILLKNILESAGYEVTTAIDGVEAITALKKTEFDLLVSDVDMPRMDGFGLTSKVRADNGLAELPVVLVTSLGSREFQERGIEAGANAYIVKSSFDQSNLLDIIRKLL